MRYLFLFTIGPVQEFIAAARRTRDLWAGSQLLSELSRVAAQALQRDFHAELIFPTPKTLNDTTRDVANRILVGINSIDTPHDVGDAITKQVYGHLETSIAREVFRKISALSGKQLDDAKAQVIDLVELYWAAVERTDNYQNDRAQLEAALAARKNTRNFQQPIWSASVPKSSIDGLRESIIPESAYPKGPLDPERVSKIKRLFQQYRAKGAERLSGVDLLKRHYLSDPNGGDFPSTSHFAALPFIHQQVRRHTGESVRAAFRDYRDHLETLVVGNRMVSLERLNERYRSLFTALDNYDASILFLSRLAEEIDTKDDATRRSAERALQQFFTLVADGAQPEPYYALLHADGDNMGKTIDHLAHDSDGAKRHGAFSQALDTFASGVRKIVEQHLGALVYSGGDDVLAFLPLHTVLPCAQDLAKAFKEQLEPFAFQENNQPITPTLSVGIAICHHLEPLSNALELARGAEKAAKKVKGKNALAITLSKRGGVDRTIAGSWEELPDADNKGFYDRLDKLTTWHVSGAIPDSAAYDLHDLIERLGETLPPAALKAEAVRIVKRKRGQQGQAAAANEALVRLTETLPDTKEAARQWNVEQFANELIVTREFAKALGFVDVNQRQGAAA